jgi:hypothetical protein
MTKQAGTAGYVSFSIGKITAVLLILVGSFALALAARTNVQPAKPSPVRLNHVPTGARHLSHAMHTRNIATGQAHTHQKQGALSNFKRHSKQSPRAEHSKRAGQGGNEGAGQGADQGAGEDTDQRADAKPKSDTTPSPTPEESPSPASDTTRLDSIITTGDTSRWPRAAATPAPWP